MQRKLRIPSTISNIKLNSLSTAARATINRKPSDDRVTVIYYRPFTGEVQGVVARASEPIETPPHCIYVNSYDCHITRQQLVRDIFEAVAIHNLLERGYSR